MAHTDKRQSLKRLRKLWRKANKACSRYDDAAKSTPIAEVEDCYAEAGWQITRTDKYRTVIIAPDGIVFETKHLGGLRDSIDAVNELMRNLDIYERRESQPNGECR